MTDSEIDTISVLDVFRNETETQTIAFSKALLELEKKPGDPACLEQMFRSAHSIKGAAQIMGLKKVSQFAHTLEDCLAIIRDKNNNLNSHEVDCLLMANDELSSIATLNEDEMFQWPGHRANEIIQLTNALRAIEFTTHKRDIEDDEEVISNSVSEDPTMVELFKDELKKNTTIIEETLTLIEFDPSTPIDIKDLVCAAHAIKGSAGIVEFSIIQKAATYIEDYFRVIYSTKNKFEAEPISLLKEIICIFESLTHLPINEIPVSINKNAPKIRTFIESIQYWIPVESKNESKPTTSQYNIRTGESVKISAENLTKILGLAAELLIQARSFTPFRNGLIETKSMATDAKMFLQDFHHSVDELELSPSTKKFLSKAGKKSETVFQEIRQQIDCFDRILQQTLMLSDRLYHEVLNSYMCPFGNGTKSFTRLVRDVSRKLGKKIKLEIQGEETLIERNMLEKLELPLQHMLRNACDHGIECPEERIQKGKVVEGQITLSAYHAAGMLMIDIKDDGCGISYEHVREKALKNNLASKTELENLADEDILDFIFMPGFSTAPSVSDLSGRGVGLDIVQDLVDTQGGAIRVKTSDNQGTTFSIQLPITRSVIKALLVSIEGELFAFPMSRIYRVALIEAKSITSIKNGAFFYYNKQKVFLVPGYAVLGLGKIKSVLDTKEQLQVIIVDDGDQQYAFEIDELKGETELVVQQIDPRLGKIAGVSAASLIDEGTPIFILDVEDLTLAADKILNARPSKRHIFYTKKKTVKPVTRILLVEDSPTVQEAERQLLESKGFHVSVANDGMLAWEQLQVNDFNLMITDVEMPNMDGLQLIQRMRSDGKYKKFPIIVVSHRDTPTDREKGIIVGADAYFSKSEFAGESFIETLNILLSSN